MHLETLFPPGARVLIRDAEWLVRRTKPTGYGDVELHVTGLSELVRDRDAIFLHPGLDEAVLLDPRRTELVADPSPGYRRTRLYLESLLRRTPPTDTRIHLGHHAAIDASAYQLVPAAQALARTEPRLLLADAVGLGKTIEIGILLSELIRRGRGRRILVVALKSVLEQFQTELWARFTIPLVRLDSEGLTRIARELPSNANPFHYYDRVLVSIDTLKNDAKYARLLEQCRWDAVVIDECQHVAMRGTGSQRAGLAKLLARTTDALLLASATPHDGRPESFASLVELLDPTALPDREHYAKDDIRDLYVRRFKKDVAQGEDRFRERRLLRHEIPASPEEDALHAALHEAIFETVRPEAVRPGGRGVLFRTLLLKSLLSSPAALAQTLDARTKRIERRLETTTTPELEAALRRDLDQLARLRALLPADDAGSKAAAGSKVAALDRLLTELEVHPRSPNRVVIFAERLETLRTLHERLRQSGFSPDQIAIFHGALSDVEQRDLTSRFSAADAPLRVLLASDAAAEGLNLHHECHRLVHYDIPWSLITLEQRNGRIDRFGQRHAPEIHYLLARPDHAEVRGDLRVLEVLLDKERRAHDALGDVQWLLRCFSPEAEEERVGEAIDAGSRRPRRPLRSPRRARPRRRLTAGRSQRRLPRRRRRLRRRPPREGHPHPALRDRPRVSGERALRAERRRPRSPRRAASRSRDQRAPERGGALMTSNPFSAVDATLGYLYQVRSALLWTLKRLKSEPDFLVGVETLDDVAFESIGGEARELLQTKHHRNATASLSDFSTDLWKTLRIWFEGTASGQIPTTANLCLVTTGVAPDGSAASHLRGSNRDVAAAVTRLDAAARSSSSAANRPAYTAYLGAPAPQRAALLARITVIDVAPSVADLDGELRREVFWAVDKEHHAPFLERLEGWWLRRVLEQLSNSSDRIGSVEVELQMSDLREGFKQESLPIDDDLLEFDLDDATRAAHENSNFVHQLDLIKAGKRRVGAAIRDYYRAFEQRSRWLRDELVVGLDLHRYEKRLIEEWDLVFEGMRDELGDTATDQAKEEAARSVLQWAERARILIRPHVTEPFVCRGSLHLLADELRIGWHPEFRDRLALLLVGEEGAT